MYFEMLFAHISSLTSILYKFYVLVPFQLYVSNVFSEFVAYLFTLMVPFGKQKFLNLMWLNIFFVSDLSILQLVLKILP